MRPHYHSIRKPLDRVFDFLLLASIVALIVAVGSLFVGCAWTNPQGVPAASVAPGQDSVVVNAERIQATSLFAYQQLTEWELANRAVLPKEVSRAVDAVRAEFKPNWELSRIALDDYKTKRGPVTTLNQFITALSVAQTYMLKFPDDNSATAQGELVASIKSLANSIAILKGNP